jgi:hypothetical protein
MNNNEQLEQRLIKAYFRKFGKRADQPSQYIEYITHDDVEYGVLSNAYRTLAIYKLFENGSFRFANTLPRHLAMELGLA